MGVVSVMPRPLYCREKRRRYVPNRSLGGTQSRSVRNGNETDFLPLPGIERTTLSRLFSRSAPFSIRDDSQSPETQ
jgi:hypothetical protein